MTNFHERIASEINLLGLKGKIVPISLEDKGTPQDWARMETESKRIDQKNNQPISSTIYDFVGKPCVD